jgi:hypothetical protein
MNFVVTSCLLFELNFMYAVIFFVATASEMARWACNRPVTNCSDDTDLRSYRISPWDWKWNYIWMFLFNLKVLSLVLLRQIYNTLLKIISTKWSIIIGSFCIIKQKCLCNYVINRDWSITMYVPKYRENMLLLGTNSNWLKFQ